MTDQSTRPADPEETETVLVGEKGPELVRPEDVEITCSGGIQLPKIGAGDGS